MSYLLPTVTVTDGSSATVQLDRPSFVQALKVTNKSLYDLAYSGFGVVGQDWIASGVEVMLYGIIQNTGVLNIQAFNTANLSPAPAGAVLVTEYLTDDPLPKGSWPVSIPAQTVNTAVSSSDRLVNTGNPPGTNVVTVQPNDAASPTALGSNEGNWTFRSDNAGTLKFLLRLIAGATPKVTIGDVGLVVQLAGSTLTFRDSGGVEQTVLDFDGSDNLIVSSPNDMQLLVPGANSIFTKVGASNITKTTTAGIQCLTGGYKGPTGDVFARCGSGSGTGSGTIAHTLGQTPDFAAITVHQSASSATVGYFSETSTQLTVTLGAALNYFVFCTRRT